MYKDKFSKEIKRRRIKRRRIKREFRQDFLKKHKFIKIIDNKFSELDLNNKTQKILVKKKN